MPPPQSPEWIYDKIEDLALTTPNGAAEAGVDWDVLVTEDWKIWEGKGWEVASNIDGLDGVERGGKFGARIKWGPKAAILVRAE
jgi:hypothetical protein